MNRGELKDKIYEILYRRFDAPRHGKYELNEATDEIAELPLPPAEGAEAFLRSHKISGADFVYTTGFENMVELLREFAAQQHPTAEGADEILADELNLDRLSPLQYNGIIRAMNKFATLHAQRIADKMVSERLREELVKCLNWVDKSTYWKEDNDIPTTLIVDEYLNGRNK